MYPATTPQMRHNLRLARMELRLRHTPKLLAALIADHGSGDLAFL